MSFGERLHHFRTLRGLTQNYLEQQDAFQSSVIQKILNENQDAPIPACSFTNDFDAAMRLKSELNELIPGLFDKLSFCELDTLIDFIHDKTREEIQEKISAKDGQTN